MSVTLTMIPLAVAVGMSLSASSLALLAQQKNNPKQEDLILETAFKDALLLHKTLTEHGLHVQMTGEEDMTVASDAGRLHYFRDQTDNPFLLELQNISNMQELLDSVDELENEYGRNVQTFTYNKVMNSLIEHGMSVESEEILFDDSILLTLNID